jgi:hypothetical protein
VRGSGFPTRIAAAMSRRRSGRASTRCATLTGRVVAFGPSGNVAQALSELKVNGGLSPLARLFRREPLVPSVVDLEYRTCAATSRAEAKTAAHRLLGLRQTAWAARMPS